MDSLWKRHQIQAIRQAVSESTLDAETVHQVMLDEISKELDKPLKEVDMNYVNACDKLLAELNYSRAAVIESHYTSNLTAIHGKLYGYREHRTTGWFLHLGITCGMIAILLFGEVLFSVDRFDVLVSPDDEQIIVQGMEGNGAVQSQADVLRYSGTYNTKDWKEAVEMYGSAPMTLKWVPEGFEILNYSIDIIEAYKSITIIYQKAGGDAHLVFTERTFYEMGMARREIEQNATGRTITLEDGTPVYITSNYELLAASWIKGNVQCTLYGSIDESDFEKCLDSIEFEKEI